MKRITTVVEAVGFALDVGRRWVGMRKIDFMDQATAPTVPAIVNTRPKDSMIVVGVATVG